MTSPIEKPVATAGKAVKAVTRVPAMLLVCGLLNYGLIRLLAPAVDPADLSNVIGLGAILEVALLEMIMRIMQRKKEGAASET